MPIEKLVAQIEPQQDLHGQDAPYPAGGGKNLLPMTLANMKTINTAGTWSGNAYTLYGVTYTVNVDDGGNVISISATGTATQYGLFRLVNEWTNASATTISGTASGSSGSGYRLQVESNGTVITQDTGTQGSIPANTSVTRVIIVVPNGVNPSGAVFKPMIRLSTDSDATFAPYSNECPITGWTGLSGGVFDVNLLNQDGTNTSNGYVHGAYLKVYDGSASPASGTWDVMEYVSVKPNTTYTLSGTTVNSSNGWAEYDINKVQVAHGMASVSPFTFTTGANTYFVRFNRNYDTDNQCQINLGSSALPYVPYTSLPISVSWQSEAGTVYGGTVDAVTGVLTVDRRFTTIGDESVSVVSGSAYANFQIIPTEDALRDNSDIVCISSAYLGKSFNGASASDDNIVFASGGNIRIKDTSQASKTASQYKTDNATVQIVYKLGTPQTYQLTPQQISTLLGNNTVFVDTGSVSVTYQSTSGSTPVRTSFKSPLASYSYNSLKLFGNTFIEHGKG